VGAPFALVLSDMPIIYALVAYKQAVQAEATTPGLTGNFGQVAKMLVQKLPATNSKLSYIYDQYMFHYIVEHSWVYLCICDLKYQRMLAFQFLNSISEFVKNPDATANLPGAQGSATPPLQTFLTAQLDQTNVAVTDAHQKLYGDIATLKDTMVENIDGLLSRGERIDLLVDRTDALHDSSFQFKRGAQRLRDAMWWKNTKLLMAISGGAACLLYVVISSSCGGLTWPQC